MRTLLVKAVVKVVPAVGALVLFAGSTRAEEPARPDFSGSWTVEIPAPAAPGGRVRGDMGSGWGSPIEITQDAQHLTVSYAFFVPGDLQPPLSFTYALDGSEAKNSVMMGRGTQVQIAHAHWDADKLVIVTTHQLVDPGSHETIAFDVTQTLSLGSPKSLVVETTRAGVLGGDSNSTRVEYSKR